MTWLTAFTVALGICISVFPLYAFTQHNNKEEDRKSAIELWKEYADELLTMTFLKKFMEQYMAQEVSYLQRFMRP